MGTYLPFVLARAERDAFLATKHPVIFEMHAPLSGTYDIRFKHGIDGMFG